MKMLVLSVKWVSLMLQCSRDSPPSSSHSEDVDVLSVKWVSLMLQCSRDSPPSCCHSEHDCVICEMGKSDVAV